MEPTFYVERLREPEIAETLADWKLQAQRHGSLFPQRCREAVHRWDWSQAARLRLGRVHALRLESRLDAIGLLALTLGGKTRAGRSCVEIVFLAKSPQAFADSISGVGAALVTEAVRLSFEFGSQGRVRIREAIQGVGEGYSPSNAYRALGFRGEGPGIGVEYEDMEITSESAGRLIGRNDHGE